MSKCSLFCITIFSALLMSVSLAAALEIPSYIEDIEDTKHNICLIIREKTATGGGFEDTALISAQKDAIVMQAIASLYAEGFTTMTGLTKDPSKVGNFVNKVVPGISSDKKQVLEQEVQTKLNSIAKRLNSIVSLEAGIAELEGTLTLRSMQNIKCSSDALAEK